MGRSQDTELSQEAESIFKELELLVHELDENISTLKHQNERGYRVSLLSSFSSLVDQAVDKHTALMDITSDLSSQTSQLKWKRKIKPLSVSISEFASERDNQAKMAGTVWEGADSGDDGNCAYRQEYGSSDEMGDSSEDEDYSDQERSSDMDQSESDDANSDDFESNSGTSSDEVLPSDESGDGVDSQAPAASSEVVDEPRTLNEAYQQLTAALNIVDGDIHIATECEEKAEFRDMVEGASKDMRAAQRIFDRFHDRVKECTGRDQRRWTEKMAIAEEHAGRLYENLNDLSQELKELSSDDSSMEVTSDESFDEGSSSDIQLESDDASYSDGRKVVSFSTSFPVSKENTAMATFEKSFVEFSNVVEELDLSLRKAPSPREKPQHEKAMAKIEAKLQDARRAENSLREGLANLRKADRAEWDQSFAEKSNMLSNLVSDFESIGRSNIPPDRDSSLESLSESEVSASALPSMDSLYTNMYSCITALENDRELLSKVSLSGTRVVLEEIVAARRQNVMEMYDVFRNRVKELGPNDSGQRMGQARGLHTRLKQSGALSEEVPKCTPHRKRTELEVRSEGIRHILDSVDIGAPIVLRIDEMNIRQEELRFHSTKLGAGRAEYAVFKDQVRLPENKKQWLPVAKELHERLKASLAAGAALEDPTFVISDLQAILDKGNPPSPRQKFGSSIDSESVRSPTSPPTKGGRSRNENKFLSSPRHSAIKEPVFDEIVTDTSSVTIDDDDRFGSDHDDASNEQVSSDGEASPLPSMESDAMSHITLDSSVPSDAERPRCFCFKLFKR